MKKLALFLAIAALTMFTGTAAMAASDSLVIGLASDALFMDPSQQDETITNTMGRYMYDGLVNTDAKDKPYPALATSWSVDKDNVTWTFNLRNGVKFHNGDNFTADDVVFTIDNAKKSLLKNFVEPIKEVKVLSPTKIQIVTKDPCAVLLKMLAPLRILPKNYYTKVGAAKFNQAPVGTGPYKFGEWVKEDRIVLKANDSYWKGAPKIKTVKLRPISNSATRTAALLTGEVDIIEDVPVRDVAKVKAASGLGVVDHPSSRLIYLHVDANRPKAPGIIGLDKNPFNDPKVRQALSLAIDRDAIVKVIMNGNAYPTNQLVLEGQGGYTSSMPKPVYDLEKAKKLLAEAGYPKGFKVYLDAPNGRYVNDGQVAQALASQLTKAGIIIELRLHPKSTFFDFVRPGNKSSLVMTGWSEPVDACELGNVLFYTRDKNPNKGGSNRCHYSNAAYDKLLDDAGATADIKKRNAFAAKSAVLIVKDGGIVPLYFQQDLYGKKANISFTPRIDKSILAYDMAVK